MRKAKLLVPCRDSDRVCTTLLKRLEGERELLVLLFHTADQTSTSLTFDGDAGRNWRQPSPMATPGDVDLVADVVADLAEEMDGGLQGEASTGGRVAAETSMFWYQRVGTVAQPACRHVRVLSASERNLIMDLRRK